MTYKKVKKYISLYLIICLSSICIFGCNNEDNEEVESSYTVPIVDNSDSSTLVAYYSFNNSSELCSDTSSHGINSVGYNLTYDKDGISGGCVLLNGINSYIDLNKATVNSRTFTFAIWANCTSDAEWQRLLSIGDSEHSFYITTNTSNSGPIGCKFKAKSDTEYTLNITDKMPLNTWTHIAFTYDKGVGKFYINGKIIAVETNIKYNIKYYYNGTSYIGRSQYTRNPYFSGKIDEAYFFKAALSSDDIAKIYSNTYL